MIWGFFKKNLFLEKWWVFPIKMLICDFFHGVGSGGGLSNQRFFDPDLFAVSDHLGEIDRRRFIFPHLFVRDIQRIP